MTIARQNLFLKHFFGKGSSDQPLNSNTALKQPPLLIKASQAVPGISGSATIVHTVQSDDEGPVHSLNQNDFLDKFWGRRKGATAEFEKSVNNLSKTKISMKPEMTPEVDQSTSGFVEKEVMRLEAATVSQTRTVQSHDEGPLISFDQNDFLDKFWGRHKRVSPIESLSIEASQWLSNIKQYMSKNTPEVKPEQITQPEADGTNLDQIDSEFVIERSSSEEILNEVDSGYFNETVDPEMELVKTKSVNQSKPEVEQEITPSA